MPDILNALSSVLVRERAAILDGDFTSLEALGDEKMALVDRIGRNVDGARLRAVFVEIDRNQGLLRAAINGVGEVRVRLAAMRDVEQSLSVYSPWGIQKIEDQTRGELSKKA